MFEFILFLGLLGVVVKLFSLAEKVSNLEKRISMSTQVKTTAEPQVLTQQNPAPQSIYNQNIEVDSEEYDIELPPDIFTMFGNWFKENWLLKTGVLLILIGFGWFVSYAFVHNWIGPVGKVALGFAVGIVLALFGSVRMDKNKSQGITFLVLGSALAIITSYASRVVYGFFTPTLSLGIVFCISAYVSLIALLFKSKSTAIFGIITAFLAPLLTHGNFDVKIMFAYLAIVSVASVWLAVFREWREINAISLLGFLLFSIPYITDIYSLTPGDKTFVSIVIFIMGFVYFIVSTLGLIQNKIDAEQSDVIVGVFDSILFVMATLAFIPGELQSITLIGLMLLFTAGSVAVFARTKKLQFFYVYALISIVLLAIATAIELEGSALIYAYIFESAIISIGGYLITRKLDVGHTLSFLMIGPALMSLPSILSDKWSSGIFHDDFGVLFVMGIVLFGLGLFYYYSYQEKEQYADTSESKGYIGLVVSGSIYFLLLVWLSSGALFDEAMAIFISLVIYTLVGLLTYFYGVMQNREVSKYYGAILLVFVILRLLFVDVWDMELSTRVITFISIGVLFISTAFISKRVGGETVQK